MNDTLTFLIDNEYTPDGDECALVTHLERCPNGGLVVVEEHSDECFYIESKAHAEKLMMGLQKAIDLGWIE